jgi:hypothetical protein
MSQPLPPRRPCTASVELLQEGLLLVRFTGHVNAAIVERVYLQAETLLLRADVRAVIVDATPAVGFDADVRIPGITFVAMLRANEVRSVFTAVSSPPLRAIGTAAALATGLAIEFTDTYDESLRRARKALEED